MRENKGIGSKPKTCCNGHGNRLMSLRIRRNLFLPLETLDPEERGRGQIDPSRWLAECERKDPATAEILTRYKMVLEAVHAPDQLEASTILHATSQDLLVDALALLRPGIDTGKTDTREEPTPLHWAAIRGRLQLVAGLLKVGADPDIGDGAHRTALSYTSESGNLDMVQVLVNTGAFPNKEDKSRRTPLSYAAAEGQDSVVEFLLNDARVVCDTTDELWQAPLHWAAKGNSLSVVAKLLQASHLKPGCCLPSTSSIGITCSNFRSASLCFPWYINTDARLYMIISVVGCCLHKTPGRSARSRRMTGTFCFVSHVAAERPARPEPTMITRDVGRAGVAAQVDILRVFIKRICIA
ncbi:ankyrin repeat-containing domain protein [Aspergillus carlsbadensis]|nr:ankyrin repeat-containing domain protein [Aspergillus carlsbadensis]